MMDDFSIESIYGAVFQPELLKEIKVLGDEKELKAGEELIHIGDYIKSIPLLLKGAIKISRIDENGEELLLYFIEKGDTCAMSLTCCMGMHKSEVKAVVEKDARVVMVPIQKMEEWSSKYKSWRNFVFESYHHRLMEALQAIDNIAFTKLDERLVNYLQEKKKLHRSNFIEVTHQQIAEDLHSSRVVISRLLKKLENKNKLKIHRNAINLLDM